MNTVVLVGINNYGPAMGGARLQGCVHDIIAEYRWIHDQRYIPNQINAVVLTDAQATSGAIVEALDNGIKAAGDGEWVLFKQSSHGADPGLVCFDSDWSDPDRTFLSADRLGESCAKANPKTKLYMDIDCCEFGDSMNGIRALTGPTRNLTNKFISNPQRASNRSVLSPNAVVPRGISNLASVAGCIRGGTCADVRDALGAYGAFTHYEIPQRLPGRTISQIISATNTNFAANGFEQRAVHTGPDWEWLK